MERIQPDADTPNPSAGIFLAHAAWLVLIISALGTLAAWHLANQTEERRAKERFDFRVEEVKKAIVDRLGDYERVLLGGAGLFTAKPDLGRRDWKNYADKLNLQRNYPGIQGFGYALVIPASQVNATEQRIKAEYYPNFRIWPEGSRPEWTSIIYLEPLDERNRRALGFDMFSEPVRREAMIRARDSGMTSASGRVTLVQETRTDVQAGFLLYVPHYRGGSALNSVSARRDALLGYVYSPFRMRDLMRGVLGIKPLELDLEIHDGTDTGKESLLFDSDYSKLMSEPAHKPMFRSVSHLDIYGRVWTVTFASLPDFEDGIDYSRPRLLLISGMLISALLFAVTLALAETRTRAVRMASSMTAALRLSEERLRTIFETVGEGIVTTDQTGVILAVNKEAERIFGQGRHEMTGRLLPALLPEQYALEIESSLSALARGETQPPREIQGQHQHGELFPLELILATSSPDARRLVVVIARDLTERKRLDRLKSEFISVVSHELRTPLTAIRGSLGLIAGGAAGAVPDKLKELIAMAMNNGDRLLAIINDILSMEKIESGQMAFDMRRHDLNTLARQAATDNAALAERQGTSFDLDLVPGEAPILGDASRIAQVLANLLSNAAKFSPAGLPIRIRTELDGKIYRLLITDKGPGIPEDFKPRVFQKFSQADSSDSRRKSGTGLGLSIAKAIIERHGGHIGFRSQPGNGATFYFELPVMT